jgi:hypothetical protein
MVPLCLLLLAQSVAGQAPREALPSFKADQVLDGLGVDNVNVYSGDVQLTVPIGPEYSLGSGITWRLTANYSNHLWNLYSYSCGTPQEPCFHPPVIQHGVLAGRSTLGAGWSLNVGYITGKVIPSPSGKDGPRYHSPDGSVHILVDQGGGIWLPEDTLHARFRFYTSPGEHWTMELPDGSTWWFEERISPPASPNGWDFFDGPYEWPNEHKQFALTRIQDRYAPSRTLLEVHYRADPRWQIDWIQMGDRRIDFVWGTFQTQADESEPARSWPALTSITFPAAHSQGLVATFAREDRRIERTSFASSPPTGCNMSAAPPTLRVPYLTGITVGDQRHSFSYAPVGMGYRGDYLLSVVLPTGGRVDYEYGGDLLVEPCLRGAPECWSLVEEMDFPETNILRDVDPSCAFDVFRSFINANAAVQRRTETDPVSPVSSYTVYRRSSVAEPTNPWPDADEPDMGRVIRGVAVSRPDGNGGHHTTKHLFSVEDRGGPTGIELQRRTYDGDERRRGRHPCPDGRELLRQLFPGGPHMRCDRGRHGPAGDQPQDPGDRDLRPATPSPRGHLVRTQPLERRCLQRHDRRDGSLLDCGAGRVEPGSARVSTDDDTGSPASARASSSCRAVSSEGGPRRYGALPSLRGGCRSSSPLVPSPTSTMRERRRVSPRG